MASSTGIKFLKTSIIVLSFVLLIVGALVWQTQFHSSAVIAQSPPACDPGSHTYCEEWNALQEIFAGTQVINTNGSTAAFYTPANGVSDFNQKNHYSPTNSSDWQCGSNHSYVSGPNSGLWIDGGFVPSQNYDNTTCWSTVNQWAVTGTVRNTKYNETWTATDSIYVVSPNYNSSTTTNQAGYGSGGVPNTTVPCGPVCQVTITHWSVVGDIPSS